MAGYIKTALGNHDIELSTPDSGKKTTVTITVVGEPASVSITAPESIEPLTAGEVTVSVRDADGNPVPKGTKVDIAATGDGAIIRSDHMTTGDSGDVSVTIIAADKDTGGLIAIFALVGERPTMRSWRSAPWLKLKSRLPSSRRLRLLARRSPATAAARWLS